MSQQLEDTTTFQAFWAAWNDVISTDRPRGDNLFTQFISQTERFAMSQMIDALDGATDVVKSYLWDTWAKKADLSGANIYDILALKSEPPESVAHIVKKWLTQVNVKNFSLDEMKTLNKDASGMLTLEDMYKFWERWITTKDLRTVTIMDLALAVKGLSPELQLSIFNGYAENCPNLNTYGRDDRAKAKDKVCDLVKTRCPLFAGSSTAATTPKYRVGQRVRIPAWGPGVYIIETVIQSNGEYRYWPEHGQRYYRETEVEVA